MTVDSYKYLPRLIRAVYETMEIEPADFIPWTPLSRPLSKSKFGLVTSGGIHCKEDLPFDLLREKQEPTWGDPTFRRIPAEITQPNIRVSHLHVNPAFVETDYNILLPIQRFRELVKQGYVSGLADYAFSFMGYQGYPANTSAWRKNFCIQVANFFKAEDVDCVLLTPSWPDCCLNVPVLARTLEANGLSTILVTMMPVWAEKVGVPRTLAVEFPFGQTLGQPGDIAQQNRIICEALQVLKTAEKPGTIIHSDEKWTLDIEYSVKTWQPVQPSPIVQMLAPQIRSLLRQKRTETQEMDIKSH